MIRTVVHYSGRVQGVGFRYTTANLAKRFEVAGYVQNLDDGKVRLDVQGDADQVDGLLTAVAETMARNITAADVTDYPPEPGLGEPNDPESFCIRY